jgi:hypothetical protein
MARHLPQEIIDRIITELDDPRHLGSCALVSRAFRPQAQRLLFSHVVLHDDFPSRQQQLAQILDQNPTLGCYAQSVDLWLSTRATIGRRGIATEDSQPTQAVRDLETIFRACSIRELDIHGAILTIDSARALSGQGLPYLKRFCASLAPVTALRDVLPKLPPLDHLELRLAHLFTNKDTTGHEHRPVRAKRLHVTANLFPLPGLSHLAPADVCAGVKELKLIISIEKLTKFINPVLEAWGAELDQLHLDVDTTCRPLRESSCLLSFSR